MTGHFSFNRGSLRLQSRSWALSVALFLIAATTSVPLLFVLADCPAISADILVAAEPGTTSLVHDHCACLSPNVNWTAVFKAYSAADVAAGGSTRNSNSNRQHDNDDPNHDDSDGDDDGNDDDDDVLPNGSRRGDNGPPRNYGGAAGAAEASYVPCISFAPGDPARAEFLFSCASFIEQSAAYTRRMVAKLDHFVATHAPACELELAAAHMAASAELEYVAANIADLDKTIRAAYAELKATASEFETLATPLPTGNSAGATVSIEDACDAISSPNFMIAARDSAAAAAATLAKQKEYSDGAATTADSVAPEEPPPASALPPLFSRLPYSDTPRTRMARLENFAAMNSCPDVSGESSIIALTGSRRSRADEPTEGAPTTPLFQVAIFGDECGVLALLKTRQTELESEFSEISMRLERARAARLRELAVKYGEQANIVRHAHTILDITCSRCSTVETMGLCVPKILPPEVASGHPASESAATRPSQQENQNASTEQYLFNPAGEPPHPPVHDVSAPSAESRQSQTEEHAGETASGTGTTLSGKDSLSLLQELRRIMDKFLYRTN